MGLAPLSRMVRTLVVAGAAALILSACAANRAGQAVNADYSNLSGPQIQASVADLAARYRADPRNKALGIHYAAALRAAQQNAQAIAVMENLMTAYGTDADVSLAYARALASEGRFTQALNVVDQAINPVAPDWDALSVRGAVLDQMGEHALARQAYSQALLLAPHQPGLHANLGLSYAMTNELPQAESHLRQAVALPGASTRVRQNLALVVGLQGRFDEARTLYAAELPPDAVSANMDYIRAMLTQQNRWEAIRGDIAG
ncbi:tetratricopeptide repeat protein [Pelagibacterium sediminicola]|uniref:tetratricopeptide repeat protein n=1 Tax=Pelagibacterium sediminicola TaxID=2248761 RepID=UPI000E3209CB|nr:tetratricopeptide repeat protein [Pelagibacterium sediminicola]